MVRAFRRCFATPLFLTGCMQSILAHSGVWRSNYPYLCRCRTLAETATKQLLVQTAYEVGSSSVPSKQTSEVTKYFLSSLQCLKDHNQVTSPKNPFQRESLQRLRLSTNGEYHRIRKLYLTRLPGAAEAPEARHLVHNVSHIGNSRQLLSCRGKNIQRRT